MTNENDGHLVDQADPWSVEHYGFGGEAVHAPTFDTTAAVSQTSVVGAFWVRAAARRLSRTTRVLAWSTVGLAVIGGLSGLAVAPAATDTSSTSMQATQAGPQYRPGPAQRLDRDDAAKVDRMALWIFAGATTGGMWLGLTAPSQSPVAPAAPVVAAVVNTIVGGGG